MFAEYIDEVKKTLTEDSVKHTLQQMGYAPSDKDRQVNICIISASRSENTPEENNKALSDLKDDLEGLGFDHVKDIDSVKDLPKDPENNNRPYPYSKTKGGWTDFKHDNAKSTEPSLKVVDIYDDKDTFINKMQWLGSKYGQWDILIKPKGEPARYLVTSKHKADRDERPITMWMPGDEHRFFKNASEADTDKDEYWTQVGHKAFKLESLLDLTEEEIDELYNVPYSKWGRDYPTYTAAHSASIARQNLNLPDFPMGFHPYGEKWTAKAIRDAQKKD